MPSPTRAALNCSVQREHHEHAALTVRIEETVRAPSQSVYTWLIRASCQTSSGDVCCAPRGVWRVTRFSCLPVYRHTHVCMYTYCALVEKMAQSNASLFFVLIQNKLHGTCIRLHNRGVKVLKVLWLTAREPLVLNVGLHGGGVFSCRKACGLAVEPFLTQGMDTSMGFCPASFCHL